jgi:hypothetical protein
VLSHTPEFTKTLFNLAALLTRSAPPHPTTNQSKVFPSSTTATSASSATVSTAVSRQVTNANRTELIMAIDIYRRLTHVELASAYERGDVSNALPLDYSCVVVAYLLCTCYVLVVYLLCTCCVLVVDVSF